MENLTELTIKEDKLFLRDEPIRGEIVGESFDCGGGSPSQIRLKFRMYAVDEKANAYVKFLQGFSSTPSHLKPEDRDETYWLVQPYRI